MTKDPDTHLREQIALFRHGLVSQLLALDARSAERGERMAALSTQDHLIPGSGRVRIAQNTLRDWMRAYTRGGFAALIPRPRADRDHSRRIGPHLAEQLIAMKQANPKLSVRLIIEALCEQGAFQTEPVPPVSTAHRLLHKAGVMRRAPDEPNPADRRRFAFERAGQLWTSDVLHGPGVLVAGRGRRKAYLIALLDDATRVVTHAQFALSENTAAFLPVFKLALIRRGLPQRLYVDNGANYRSHHLALVCAKLGVALIHSRPHQPQGRGKIERFFRTVRAQLLTRLTDDDTASLEALNRRLAGWIEGEYHHTPHAGLEGATPLDRWAQVGDAVCYPSPDLDLDDLFLFEATRKVANDRTVSLNGVLFEVDAVLVGERVTLRFDPATPLAPVQVVHQGKVIEQARRVDLYANCFVKRHRPSGQLQIEQTLALPDAAPDTAPAPPPAVSLALAALARQARNEHGQRDEPAPPDHPHPDTGSR